MSVQTAARMSVNTVAELARFTRHASQCHRTEHGNAANAVWAGAALAKYGNTVRGEHTEPLRTVFTDLLGDLLHLADALNLDFDDALRTAAEHYTAEVDGE
ncbi:hypothetical protein [Rhodococcus koreensis]